MSDPWNNTTHYGRADLTLDGLVREAYKVGCLIERCGASPDLTEASSTAFALCEALSDHFAQLHDATARIIELERELAAAREALEGDPK